MQIQIEEATAKQLADFAAAKGLDGVNYRMGTFEIIRRLREAGYAADVINVVEGPVVAAKLEPDTGKKIKIFIEQQEGPGGSEPVFVGVNGRHMLIPRGEWSFVKPEFVEVLEHCVRTVIDPVPMDPSKPMDIGGTLPPRDVLQYPFRTERI